MENTLFRVIDNTVLKAQQNAETCSEDYKNAEGLLICGKCHTPRQKFLEIDKSNVLYERFKNRAVPVLCKCRSEEKLRQEARMRQLENDMLIARLRSSGITDRQYLDYTFEQDDNENPKVSKMCKRYADNFDEMYTRGQGLIFCGQVGTGKTFFAGCIANAVISQARSVLMTNMPRLITKLAYDSEDRNYTLQRIESVSLLVIDDLGVERNTSYSLEKIYEIFDTRFRAKKPLIVTTNIAAKAMKDEQNAEYRRIYDRILQMCYPIAVLGESRRAKAAQQSSEFMSEFLGVGE